MVIIKLRGLTENIASSEKKQSFICEADAVRRTVIIRGKPHYIVEISEKSLKNAELIRLLNAYKGNVLLSKELENVELFKEYTFDISPFLRRVCFDGFLKAVKSKNDRSLTLCIRNTEKCFSLDAEKILRYVKELSVICSDEDFTLDFPQYCYKEYGVKPFVTTDLCFNYQSFDVFADFDSISENKYLKYLIRGTEEKFFPDFSAQEIDDELIEICNLGVRKENIIASFMK